MKRSELGYLLNLVHDNDARGLARVLQAQPQWATQPWASKNSALSSTARAKAPRWFSAREHDDGRIVFRNLLELAMLVGTPELQAVVLPHLSVEPKPLNALLRQASECGQLDLMTRLLQQGASGQARAKSGSTALLCAATQGHTAAVALLLNHGARPQEGEEAQAALRTHHWGCLDLLLPHVPRRQAQALHRRAIKAGSGPLPLFEALVERDALARVLLTRPRRHLLNVAACVSDPQPTLPVPARTRRL